MQLSVYKLLYIKYNDKYKLLEAGSSINCKIKLSITEIITAQSFYNSYNYK